MKLNDTFSTAEIPLDLLGRADARCEEPPAGITFEGGYLLSECCRELPYWNASNVLEKLSEAGLGDVPVVDLLDERGNFTGSIAGLALVGVCGSCGRPVRLDVDKLRGDRHG